MTSKKTSPPAKSKGSREKIMAQAAMSGSPSETSDAKRKKTPPGETKSGIPDSVTPVKKVINEDDD